MNEKTLALWSRIYPHFGDPDDLYDVAADWLADNVDDEPLILYRPVPLEDLPLEDVERVEPVVIRGEDDLPEPPDVETFRGFDHGLREEDHYLRHMTVRGRWYGAVEGPAEPPEFLDDVLGTLGEFIDLGADYRYHRERSGMSQWLIETGEILQTSQDDEDVIDRLFELVCRRLDVHEAGYYTRSGSRYQLTRTYGFDRPDDRGDLRDRAVVTLEQLGELGLDETERKVLVQENADEGTVDVYLPLAMGDRDLGLVVLYNFPVPEEGLSDFDRFVMSSLSTLSTITLNTMEVRFGGEEHVIEDDLTSLKTDRYFEHQLELEIERGERYGLPCSILVAEVENYEGIVESHGRQTAREVMRKLGHIIRQNFRRIDVGGRLSEDEVAILYPNTNLEEAMISSARLEQLVGDPFLPGAEENVSVAIRGGVAGYPRDGTEGEELVKKARLALYEARQTEESRILSTEELEGSEA